MGLANNEILKTGVDLLTGLINTVNNLTSALSNGKGLVKSLVNLVTIIGALKGGLAMAKGVFGQGRSGLNAPSHLLVGVESTVEAEKAGIKDGNAYANGFTRAL
jgi:hypothetical protein